MMVAAPRRGGRRRVVRLNLSSGIVLATNSLNPQGKYCRAGQPVALKEAV